jgi:hypothetical protein
MLKSASDAAVVPAFRPSRITKRNASPGKIGILKEFLTSAKKNKKKLLVNGRLSMGEFAVCAKTTAGLGDDNPFPAIFDIESRHTVRLLGTTSVGLEDHVRPRPAATPAAGGHAERSNLMERP